MLKRQLNTISAYQIYQLIRYATLFLVGVVLAKSVLSQSDIGEYETFLFLAAAVSFFWVNGLLKAMMPLTNKFPKTAIFSTFILISLFSLLAILLLLLFHPYITKLLLNDSKIIGFPQLLLYIFFGMPAMVIEFYYIVKSKNRQLIIYGFISFSSQFIIVSVPALLGYNLMVILNGLVIISIARYVWFWILMIRGNHLHFSKNYIHENLQLGWPLIFAMLLSGSARFVDGFIITSKFDEAIFAIFRFGARELPLAILLTNALNNAMLSEFNASNSLAQSLSQLKSSVNKLMDILFPVTIVLMILSYPLFPIFFNSGFRESATIFNIYLLLIVSRLLMPQTILNGLLKTKDLLVASFFELVINVALSLWFVTLWGIQGVAYATVIAFLFEKIYLTYKVYDKFDIKLQQYVPITKYALYSLITIVVFIFTEYYFN